MCQDFAWVSTGAMFSSDKNVSTSKVQSGNACLLQLVTAPEEVQHAGPVPK